jgi:hypothetical protein
MATMAREPENRPQLSELRDTLVEHAAAFEEPDWPPSSALGSRAPSSTGPTVHLGDVPSIPRFDAAASGVVTNAPAQEVAALAGESGERNSNGDAHSVKSTRGS